MENIEVILRIRPINTSEINSLDTEIWETDNQDMVGIPTDKYNDLVRMRKIAPGQKNLFNFNLCYDQNSRTQEIYERSIKRIALSGLQGINGTVFMYGQTGSGKTHTMMGNKFDVRNNITSKDKNSTTEFSSYKNSMKNSIENNKRKNNNYGQLLNEFVEQSPYPPKPKTPNRFEIGNSPAITNIQIDLNNLMNESDEKQSLFLQRNFSQNFLNSDANPLYTTKTHDLFENNENQEGILQFVFRDIFNEIEKQNDKKFFVRCSYLEIYTDQIYDLLKEQNELHETLTINEDLNKDFYVKGAKDEIVSSIDDIMSILKKGENNRHYASTMMNHCSSRSHTIFRMFLQCIPSAANETRDIYTESILNFVDLAGSEKISIHDHFRNKTRDNSVGHYSSNNNYIQNGQPNTNTFKERVNESKHINKSLFFLTQVISLKSQGKMDLHIPFRNSPLTKILRSSLGGNSRTSIILCINPCLSQYEQSISTMRFGLNAKKIENQITKNIITSNNDILVKNLIKDYEKKIHDMEKENSEDKTRSQNLLNIIEKLQEQKNLIEERLNLAKKTEIFNKKPNLIINIKKKNNFDILGDYIHLKNIGILHFNVLQSKEEKQFKFDSEGSYALKGMKIMKDQKDVMEQKYEIIRRKNKELEDQNQNYLNKINQLEEKLVKKKLSTKNLKQKCLNFSKTLDLYQNKNSDSLKRLPLEKISLLEKNLQNVLENLKTEKLLKSFMTKITSLPSDKYQELFKTIKNPEDYKPISDFISDILSINSNTILNTQSDIPHYLNEGLNPINDTDFKPKESLKSITSYLTNERRQSENSNNSINKEENNQDLLNKEYFGSQIDSFQTYFDKESFKKEPSICETDLIKPLDIKLAELHKSFQEIKEKIIEHNNNSKDNKENLKFETTSSKIIDSSYCDNLDSFENIKNEGKKEEKNGNSNYLYFLQNKENLLNFKKNNNDKKVKSNKIFKYSEDERKNLRNNGNKNHYNSNNSFERQVEILKNNPKLYEKN